MWPECSAAVSCGIKTQGRIISTQTTKPVIRHILKSLYAVLTSHLVLRYQRSKNVYFLLKCSGLAGALKAMNQVFLIHSFGSF